MPHCLSNRHSRTCSVKCNRLICGLQVPEYYFHIFQLIWHLLPFLSLYFGRIYSWWINCQKPGFALVLKKTVSKGSWLWFSAEMAKHYGYQLVKENSSLCVTLSVLLKVCWVVWQVLVGHTEFPLNIQSSELWYLIPLVGKAIIHWGSPLF